MANAPLSTVTSGVSNALLSVFAKRAVAAPKIRGNPLKMITDVSDSFTTYGQTVVINVAPTRASALLTDGNTRALNDSPPTQVNVTVNRHRYDTCDVTDVLRAFVNGSTFIDSLIDGQISGVMNDTQTDVFSNVTGNFTTNVVGSYSTPVTDALFMSLRTKIVNQKAPQGWLYGLLASTDGAFSAFAQLENVVRANQRGYMEASPSIKENYGQDVRYQNVSVSECQAVPNNAGSIDNFIFHPNALAVCFRPLYVPDDGTGVKAQQVVDAERGLAYTMQMSYNFTTFAPEITFRTLYGTNVLKEQWGGILKSN